MHFYFVLFLFYVLVIDFRKRIVILKMNKKFDDE